MISPDEYNPEGKKLTYLQHMQKMNKYREEQQKKMTQSAGEKPGRCPKCDGGKFSLHLDMGKLVRTCKNESCKAQKLFD